MFNSYSNEVMIKLIQNRVRLSSHSGVPRRGGCRSRSSGGCAVEILKHFRPPLKYEITLPTTSLFARPGINFGEMKEIYTKRGETREIRAKIRLSTGQSCKDCERALLIIDHDHRSSSSHRPLSIDR